MADNGSAPQRIMFLFNTKWIYSSLSNIPQAPACPCALVALNTFCVPINEKAEEKMLDVFFVLFTFLNHLLHRTLDIIFCFQWMCEFLGSPATP